MAVSYNFTFIHDVHTLSCVLLPIAQVLSRDIRKLSHYTEEGKDISVFFIITFLLHLKGIHYLPLSFSKMENTDETNSFFKTGLWFTSYI